MQDRQLYQQILGIESPWVVERVELKLEDGEVHVHLARPKGLILEVSAMQPPVPASRPSGDQEPGRHLDTLSVPRRFVTRPCRDEVPSMRLVRSWAEPGATLPGLFERLAIDQGRSTASRPSLVSWT